MFVNVTKLSGAVNMPEGKDAIQRDFKRLKRWACMNFMRFSKVKHKVLHLSLSNIQYQHGLGDDVTEQPFGEGLEGIYR